MIPRKYQLIAAQRPTDAVLRETVSGKKMTSPRDKWETKCTSSTFTWSVFRCLVSRYHTWIAIKRFGSERDLLSQRTERANALATSTGERLFMKGAWSCSRSAASQSQSPDSSGGTFLKVGAQMHGFYSSLIIVGKTMEKIFITRFTLTVDPMLIVLPEPI